MTSTDFPLCENCLAGHYIPGEPAGKIIKLDDVEYYVATPRDANKLKEGKVIVIFTDVFGIAINNNKLIADLLANEGGYTVYVPDIFNGELVAHDAIDLSKSETPPTTFFQKFSVGLSFVPIIPWFIRHRQSVTQPIVDKVLHHLKNREDIKRIGAVGYCFGGKYSILAGATDFVDVVAAVHPSMVGINDIKAITKPIAFLCAEHDQVFTEALRLQSEKALKEAAVVPHSFKVYPGTVHGFAARPNFGVPEIKSAFEDVHKQLIIHFDEYL